MATVRTNLRTTGNARKDCGAEVAPAQARVARPAPTSAAREHRRHWIGVADTATLEEMSDDFARQSFNLAYRLLARPGVAEQATQEACIQMWLCPATWPDRHPAGYSTQERRFQNWLLSVTHNRSLAELRLLRLRHPEVAREAIERSMAGNLVDIMVDAALSAADRKLLRDGQPPLHQVVGQLASAQRQVLELAYFSGLSQVEIAIKLRRSLGKVKSHTRMALRKLQAMSNLSS